MSSVVPPFSSHSSASPSTPSPPASHTPPSYAASSYPRSSYSYARSSPLGASGGEPPAPPRLSLTVEVDRAERVHVLLGEAAQSLLTAIGAPEPLAHRMTNAARVAGQYLVGRSEHPRCRLRITTDAAGVTLAVSDYIGQDGAGRRPAWRSVFHTDHGLDLHRTPDGHLRFAYYSPWPAR